MASSRKQQARAGHRVRRRFWCIRMQASHERGEMMGAGVSTQALGPTAVSSASSCTDASTEGPQTHVSQCNTMPTAPNERPARARRSSSGTLLGRLGSEIIFNEDLAFRKRSPSKEQPLLPGGNVLVAAPLASCALQSATPSILATAMQQLDKTSPPEISDEAVHSNNR